MIKVASAISKNNIIYLKPDPFALLRLTGL